ncbi:TonB-dependent hemoglobin/transferrin/lactoferrin family receptor [Chrysosporum ovalisporum ANA283AFssAo]|uniref:TonB-dependent hemoglobin/transferrin/lactoferrin family receptor n=1 Tax=Umezakia ovalisporum TaxID=75695 RepID=UPI002477229D|nr:TonB-dependent hemoglobin/transferrin/lactoferrin family receptor [Umezakia ovalisporum]MDH6102305.1 TonB-dependent hemoglobin/transferrin/lactoferrin family receptor [Umezakia ovalisporum ANA283AFssAo]
MKQHLIFSSIFILKLFVTPQVFAQSNPIKNSNQFAEKNQAETPAINDSKLLSQEPVDIPVNPEEKENCPPDFEPNNQNENQEVEDCKEENEDENKTNDTDIVITVTATRTEREIIDSVGTISIIDDKKIERDFIQDIKDLVRYEPGISVNNRPLRAGNSSINIRGIEGNRVLIQVDGVRVPDIYFNSSRDLVGFDTIQRVEILRGPASTLYGSDAIGGVVSFFTKDPQDYLSIFGGNRQFYVSGKGSYNTADYSFSPSLTLAGKSGNLSSLLQYTRRDGKETQNYGGLNPNPQDFDSNNLFTKVVLQGDENNIFRLTGELFERRVNTQVKTSEGFSSFTRTTTVSQVAEDFTSRGRISLSHEYRNPHLSSFLQSVRWQIYYQSAESTEDVETRTINNANQNLRRILETGFNQDIFGGDVQFTSKFFTGDVSHRLVYGFDLFNTSTSRPRDSILFNETLGTSTKNVSGELFPNKTFPDTQTWRGGIYIQNEIELADGGITLIPGMRYDYYQLSPKTNDVAFNNINTQNYAVEGFSASAISPKLGILTKITPEISLYGQYARGFRSPPYDDANIAFTNFAFGYTVLPNADLKPETVDSYELGIRANYPQSTLGLTGFYNRYHNFIESNVELAPVVIGNRSFRQFQAQNIKGATIYGLEAKGEYRFSQSLDGLSLFATLAYAVGDNLETEQPLDSVDPFKAILGLRYSSPQEVWGAELTTTLVAAKDRVSDENFFKPQGYTTVDVRSFYNFNENTTLNLGIFNLFNEGYTEWSSVRGVSKNDRFLDLYTQPGINFAASLSVRF